MTPAEVLKRDSAKARRSALERTMELQLRAAGLTAGMVREYRPFADVGYRYDFAWPDGDPIVLLELEGGIWSGGAHARPKGITRDIDKGNRAALSGWVLIRATTDHVKSGQALSWVQQALTGAA